MFTQYSSQGLSSSDAQKQLLIDGFNELDTRVQKSALKRFLLQCHHFLIYILLISATVTFFLGHYSDAFVIVGVVMINATIGMIQEGKAEKAIDSIRRLMSLKAHVIRDGQKTIIPAKELVKGDIVIIEAGDKVPADASILESYQLMADESILTGESYPVDKEVSSTVFSGTIITKGQGICIVSATGIRSEIGKIQTLMNNVQQLDTPLIKNINNLSHKIGTGIVMGAIILMLVGLWWGHLPFQELFLAIVGLSIAAIPEGLPAVLTLTLAKGVQTMAKQHVIVRKLPAIETIGAVSIICTDKTGTLTMNQMHVESVLSSRLDDLEKVSVLCNDGACHNDEYIGDPLDVALLKHYSHTSFTKDYQRLNVLPFDSGHKFMATCNQHITSKQRFLCMKGAPEVVLNYCSHSQKNLDELNNLTRQGQRVIAFAICFLEESDPMNHNMFTQMSYDFVGFIGLIDPPRPMVKEAISECYQAGISIKMITGDHPQTALAIAEKIGLNHQNRVLTGQDLDHLNEEDFLKAVYDCHVFARTTPTHKLRLVEVLQNQGDIVAMTGDGVNDAPALKKADVGIAMGQKGSEAAKEAAEVVIANDCFNRIVSGIEQGRLVYDNIKKILYWTLATGFAEGLVIAMALLLGRPCPITPVQVLWINLILGVTLGIVFAFEPFQSHLMTCPPRKSTERLLNKKLLCHTVVVSLLFAFFTYLGEIYANHFGYSVKQSQTMTMTIIVFLEIFHLIFIKWFFSGLRAPNLMMIPMIILSLVSQLGITYTAIGQKIFGLECLCGVDYVFMGILGGIFWVVMLILKEKI